MTSKIKTNIIKIGEYRFTSDGIFAIKPIKPKSDIYILTAEFQTNSDYLYVRSDYKLNDDSALQKLINGNFIINNGTIKLTFKRGGLDFLSDYNEYKFYRTLIDERKYNLEGFPIEDGLSINENDCLKFAECLTFANEKLNKEKFNEMLKAEEGPPILQSYNTNIPFGATEKDEDNIKILKLIKQNDKNNFVVPKDGESYAIVRKKIIDDKAPYHIAFVLYTNGSVNITLEAEADNQNNYQPKFCFYDINPDGNTFHRRWSAELYKNDFSENGINRYNNLYNNGETIVLKSNLDNIVIETNEKVNEETNEKVNEEMNEKVNEEMNEKVNEETINKINSKNKNANTIDINVVSISKRRRRIGGKTKKRKYCKNIRKTKKQKNKSS